MDRLGVMYAEALPRIATEGLSAMGPDRCAAHDQALGGQLGA
ncbi:MAG TPA: hypothetical protein VF916_00145 [Ktedonobacterales bacterium]|jgi:hypothetical protein